MSRAKENIILLIDSSPSCRREAAFFAAVSSVAAKYDFIDMYDAPNMRITGKYNAKTMKFEHCWTDEQILAGMHKWPHFKDKNILAFGDDDGRGRFWVPGDDLLEYISRNFFPHLMHAELASRSPGNGGVGIV